MWTRFMDMHSGGACKQKPHEFIYIELPCDEAIKLFEARFGHDPCETACACCGPNYSIDEDPSFEQASSYDRNCDWDDVNNEYAAFATGQPITEYEQREDVLVLRVAKL